MTNTAFQVYILSTRLSLLDNAYGYHSYTTLKIFSVLSTIVVKLTPSRQAVKLAFVYKSSWDFQKPGTE